MPLLAELIVLYLNVTIKIWLVRSRLSPKLEASAIERQLFDCRSAQHPLLFAICYLLFANESGSGRAT